MSPEHQPPRSEELMMEIRDSVRRSEETVTGGMPTLVEAIAVAGREQAAAFVEAARIQSAGLERAATIEAQGTQAIARALRDPGHRPNGGRHSA